MEHEHFIRSFDGTELFVSSSGTGDVPLVLCDGLGCDGFIWRFLKPHFEPRYRVVHWHYRAHGASQVPSDPSGLSIDAILRDLHAVLDAVELERAVLLGHSMGCQVILDFALEHASRVLGVIPICGAYGRPLDTFHDNKLLSLAFPLLRRAAEQWPAAGQLVWRSLVTSELTYQVAKRIEVNGRLVRREAFAPYFAHLAKMDARVFLQLAGSANQHSVEERLGEVAVPTLIIAGDRDTFTPVWLSRRMHNLVPGSELLELARGTHAVPLEMPDLVHARIERFLTERIVSAHAPRVAAQGGRGEKERRASRA